jgi:DNA repair protein RecO (recombination protein O)
MAQRAILRTEAIVLRSLDYGETSQIVTLFTREKGKTTVMAKGARRPKSTFGATLQPMAYTQVVFYFKPTRTLHMLRESSHMEPFHAIRQRLDKIGVGLRIVELVDALVQDEDPQPTVFDLALRALRHLDQSDKRIANIWPFVQLRMASALGVAPAVQRDAVEAVTESHGWLSLNNGSVHPLDAEPRNALRASRSALRAYAICARAPLPTVGRMRMHLPVQREMEQMVEAYMQHHFEEAYPTRGRDVLAQLRPSLSG